MNRNGDRESTEKRKRGRFDYEAMKADALHEDPARRKAIFLEYFERFSEFPSYVFDEKAGMDSRLRQTIDDIRNDKDSSERVLAGIDALEKRLEL